MATFTVKDPKTGQEVTLTSQDNTPPTEQELEQIFSSSGNQQQSQPQEGNKFLSNEPIQEEQSPLSLKERLFLGAVNDRDREKYLRSKYSNVQKLQDGKFAVGNDSRNLQPVDPQGIFNDVLGDLADVASEIPVIAGQIIGGTVGATAGPGGAIAGSAAGAGVGELGKTAIGKMSGIDERKAEEIATDMAISSAFGAAGESLAIGTKVFGKKVLAPKLSSMMDKLSKGQAQEGAVAPNNTTFANATKKIFHYLSGVKEESTDTFFKYGFKEMSNPEHFEKSNILKIVDDTVKALDDTTKDFGQEVRRQTNALKGLSKNKYINTSELFNVASSKARELGIIDDLGRINKNHPVTQEIKPVVSLLKELGDIDNGRFVANPNKKITVDKAIQLSRTYGDKFDSVSGKVQNIFHDVLNGSDDIGVKGLRQNVVDIAESLGLKEYSLANQKYASLMGLRERLTSLDTRNPGKIESFINRLENVGRVQQRDLATLDNMIGGNLLKRWELFNSAQDFSKSNINMLRFGSIAATLAALSGFESKESRVGTIAGAALLGTPSGLKTLIRLGNRIGRPMSKEALKNIGSKIGSANKSQVSTAILSRLLEQQTSNNAKNNKKSEQQKK